MSNVLPAYSSAMGPPAWVSSPTASSYGMSTTADVLSEVEDLLTGAAMARLQSFNTPPEHILANLSTAPLQAITWEMLEAACKSCAEYRLLHDKVQMGLPEQSKDWDHLHTLTVTRPLVHTYPQL